MTLKEDTPIEMTLEEAFEIYRTRSYGGPGGTMRSASTLQGANHLLTTYAPSFWKRPIGTITAPECATLFKDLTTSGRPGTANRTLCCMRAVINVAQDACRWIDGELALHGNGNPVSLMFRRTRLNPGNPWRGHVPLDWVPFAWQDLKQLGEWAHKPSTRTAADLLRLRMMTGMWNCDARTLRFSHIHFEDNVIEVPQTLTMRHRDLPMAPMMRELLEHRRTLHLAAAADDEAVSPDAYVFASNESASGHIMSARTLLKRVAGDEITQFDVRRTFANVACACGIEPHVTRRLLTLTGDRIDSMYFDLSKAVLVDALTRITQYMARLDDNQPAADAPTTLH